MENGLQQVDIQAQMQIIPSLMVPLATRMLLVPTVSVAEIVSCEAAEPIDHGPNWLQGYFLWRNQKVPLISLELLNGEPAVEQRASSRIAVFNNTGVSHDLPFIAVSTNGIPKLSQVGSEDLAVSATPALPFETMRVILDGEELVIPDITALEQLYLDWLRGYSNSQ